MVESYNNQDQEGKIFLGFIQRPKNSLLTTAAYTPSKIGGQPAWLCPQESIPAQRCQYCGYHLQFLLQLYANSNDATLADYHRTLYVFTCLSPQCISTQRAVQVYRSMIKHENPHVKFADDEIFNEVQNLYEQQLIDRGLIQLTPDPIAEEESKERKPEKDIQIIFKEYLIANEVEDYETTQFYLKESRRIRDKKPKAQEDDDSDDDNLENQYLRNQANSGKDKRQVEKLMKKTLKDEEKSDSDDDEDEDQEKIDEIEMIELEKLIKNNHSNYQQISDHYKLCEIVSKSDPEQVLRYVNNRDKGTVEPLWMSEKNIIEHSKVLNCERCGQARSFEFQIMPQLFDFIKEFLLVDWNTIVFYTCSNPKCLPDYESGQYFVREFSYIQFSDDFEKVQYGDDKQIEKQNQQKKQQEQAEQQAQKESQGEELKTEEPKKKKSKKNKQEKPLVTRDEVNQEVQNQLQDLMNDLNFQQK